MIEMFENILENKLFKSSMVTIVCIMIILLIVPATRDSKDVVRNETTGQLEFKQVVNEVFIFAIIMAIILPLLLFNVVGEQKQFPKRMTLPEVWSKIPRAEIVKFDLQGVESILMRGEYFYGQSSRNKNIFHLRYTDHEHSCITNIALYVMDDFSKFMNSPLVGITTMPLGLDSAQTRLIKIQDLPARVVQTAETLGISAEEIKRRLLQKELEVQNQPVMEDENNENQR